MELLNKYKVTGQVKGMRKLLFHLKCIEKEREIVKAGIDTFVYRDDIEYYIDNVTNDVVKIIDIESYEREIPDEIVDIIAKYGKLFDQLYIVFTDYTGEAERKVEEERRFIKECKEMDSQEYCECCGANLLKHPWNRRYGLCDRCDIQLEQSAVRVKRLPWGRAGGMEPNRNNIL